ncbi:PadR family transcriptional regulator, partial [Lactiplantibacillus plantarum]
NDWVTTYDQAYQGRNRRYYQITSAGLTQLSAIQQEWQTYYLAINHLLQGEDES